MRVLNLIACLLVTSVWTTNVNLLRLKHHWVGNGGSFFIPNSLRIMAEKLRSQCGQMSSYTALPAGEQWSLTLNVVLRCKDFSNAGIGIFLTTKSPIQSNPDYTCQKYAGTFGFHNDISGLGLTLHNHNLYVGQYNSTSIRREHLTHWAKTCRASFKKDDEVALIIRNRVKNMSIYLLDVKTQTETLCVQMNQDIPLEDFFLTVSGFDEGGYCDASIKHTDFFTESAIQEIPEDSKKPGDSFFAFYTNHTESAPDVHHFQKVYDYYRQNSKIMVNELLTFADKNEKEIVSELKKEYQNFSKNLTAAMSILEKEAEQISLLSSVLIEDRRNSSTSITEMLNQVLSWMDTMVDAYQRVNNETLRIYNMVQEMNVDYKVESVLNKTSSIIKQLDKVLNTTITSFESAKLSDEKKKSIANWGEKIDALAGDLKKKMIEQKKTSGSALRKLGIIVLGAITCLIFFAFGFLYWKIKKAAEFKRIL